MRLVLVGASCWLFVTSAHAEDGLRIADAVQLALGRNERAKISDLNVAVADAAVQSATTRFLPTLTFTASDSQRPNDIVRPPGATNNGTAALTLVQPLLNASAFPLLGQAKQQLEGTKAQTVDDKRLLAYDAARAFFAVLSAEAVVAAADRRLGSAKANLADTQARAQAQLVSTNDVTRSTIDMADATRELESDKGVVAVAYVNLAFTLNSPAPKSLAIPSDLLAAGRQTLPAPETLVGYALDHRPDLKSRRHFATAAHDFADEPLLRLVPTLSLVAQVSGAAKTDIQGPSPANPAPWNDESIQASLTWTIFDAGNRYADRRSREASANVADLNTTVLVRGVDQQVRAALASLQAAQNALTASEQARDAAKKSAEETGILYKQGLAKAIELVDANDSRFLAEVNAATAEYSVALAYLALRQALGLDPIGTELK